MFLKGDKLKEVNDDDIDQHTTVWTFKKYNKDGYVVLEEFNESYNWSSSIFRKLTKLEQVLE